MRVLKWIGLACVLAIAANLYWATFQPEYQFAERTLYAGAVGDRFVPVESPTLRNYRATFSMAAKGLRVPLRLTWSAARDSTGCLRVGDVALKREGGSTKLRIDSVSVTYFGCDRNGSGALVERAQMRAMRWVTGGGVTEGRGGTVADFSGGGDFEVALGESEGIR